VLVAATVDAPHLLKVCVCVWVCVCVFICVCMCVYVYVFGKVSHQWRRPLTRRIY